MQTPDKWQIEGQANTNKSNGIYTHTYRQKKTKNSLKQTNKQTKKKKSRRDLSSV